MNNAINEQLPIEAGQKFDIIFYDVESDINDNKVELEIPRGISGFASIEDAYTYAEQERLTGRHGFDIVAQCEKFYQQDLVTRKVRIVEK